MPSQSLGLVNVKGPARTYLYDGQFGSVLSERRTVMWWLHGDGGTDLPAIVSSAGVGSGVIDCRLLSSANDSELWRESSRPARPTIDGWRGIVGLEVLLFPLP